MDFTTEVGAWTNLKIGMSEAMGTFTFIIKKQRKVIAFAAGWQAAAYMESSTLPIKP